MKKTADAARGKWRGILMSLGIDQRFLTGKHGPCPMCEGRDRFRWDNQDGGGGFICSQCGAGNGFDLIMRLKGWDFAETAREVDRVVGNVKAEPIKPPIDQAARVEMLNRLWSTGVPPWIGDPAYAYLSARGAVPTPMPSCLRFTPVAPVPYGGGMAPALIALVLDKDGRPANLHRTFLTDPRPGEGRQRAMMPGEIPPGSAVRLFPVHGSRLGIAEGIETAIRASQRFGVPVWSAINATMLAKWEPPAGVDEVLIFGDNDPKFGGQSAAFTLAHRLACRTGLTATVHIPQQVGLDWAHADAA